MRALALLLILLPGLAVADCVIVLHGLARTANSMLLMELRLEEEGYTVVNETYPSTEHPLPDLIREVVPARLAMCPPWAKVHFVTHSMGGIIVRGYLAENDVADLGRIVMLAPPNKGSALVDRVKDLPGFETLNGPAGMQLGVDMDSVPRAIRAVDAEIGVIAGDLSLNPLFSAFIEGPNDGKVAVEETKLEGMADHIVLPVSHTFMMNSADVFRQTLAFLRSGRFEREE